MLFGDNIASFFGENNTLNKATNISNKTYVSINDYNSNDVSNLDTNTSTIEELYDTKYGKIIDSNGTKSIQLNSGVQIDLPENFYETFESTIVDATGAQGMDLFMKKMDEMLTNYYESNPGVTNADIDMGIGHSDWETAKESGGGPAYYHIQVDNEIFIYYYEGQENDHIGDSLSIEGQIDKDGNISSDNYCLISSLEDLDNPNNLEYWGTYTGKVSEDKKSIEGTYTEDKATGTWDFYSDNNFEFVAKTP